MKDKTILDIAKAIEAEISHFAPVLGSQTVGQIMEVGDGIATVSGLSDVMMGEILQFPGGVKGLTLNLNKDTIGVIILSDTKDLKEGDLVKRTGKLISIGVSHELLGRVISPLGEPLDGRSAIKTNTYYPLEKVAPGVIDRQGVKQPIQTGIIAIDAMIPIGRGQRELIIGDRTTGKSSVALTTVINQRKSGVKCIYVMIGQKRAFVAQTMATLEKFKAMENTIIIAATASDPAAQQYLAPYAGAAIAEYFADKGEDALIIYDDLTKHAWAYREISLLLRRPSGREAYPGDVFYLHSRLLERAIKFSDKKGGGSITALPIIETQAADLSAYIPTNVISITDGQIYLEADLFNAGVRPAINAGASVSRVGSSAQIKAMKQVAGKLRLDLAQYRELAAFAQFSADLDKSTRDQLERGHRITEILKQGWDEPMLIENQVIIMWAVNNGYLDTVPINKVKEWQSAFLRYCHSHFESIGQSIVKELILSDNAIKLLTKAGTKFNEQNPNLLNTPEE
ncbi:F0F1 ATP synthase subunit alpha [Microgenomates group bacterium RIFCSPLOWO2_01_FULL_47_10]|nr:MAG: F0F1 ATP synthase subunit alpha [Microgenomates group bacterium RIFCSPLOWO2_01_FULL_47_10]